MLANLTRTPFPASPLEHATTMIFMLTYQLRSSDPAAREGLENAIKKLGNWSRRMPNVWLVESRANAPQIRDYLKQHLGPNDALFVARITKNWAGRNMGEGFAEWMGRRDFGSFAPAPASGEEQG